MIGVLAAVGAVAAALSARWNWWRPAVSGGMPVLMYHKIGDYPPGSELKKLWVTTADFRKQLESAPHTAVIATGARRRCQAPARSPS